MNARIWKLPAVGKQPKWKILPHLQDTERAGLIMAKGRSEKEDSEAMNEDHEIEQAVAELEGIRAPRNIKTTALELPEIDDKTPFEELSNEEVAKHLQRSGKMVINTCMDIRRGENVLIVCDPTTGDIGQALHEAANERSDRVLLIVMPKARHHGEEPPTPCCEPHASTAGRYCPHTLLPHPHPSCASSAQGWCEGSHHAWDDQ